MSVLYKVLYFFPLKLLHNFVAIYHYFSPAWGNAKWLEMPVHCIPDMAAIWLQQGCIEDHACC